MIGIYVFFLFSSFRGRVEANWTSPVLVSLMVLSHQFLNEKITPIAIGGQKLLFRLLPLTLVLVLFARIIMIVDILPVKGIQQRYHAWKDWPKEMKERTKSLPIVFSNSYQRASKYWFYTGQMTYSQNHYRERRNNFNFWPIEDSMLGKPVYFLDKHLLSRFPDSLKTPIGWVGYMYDSSLSSFAKINIEVNPKKIKEREGREFSLTCRFEIPEHYSSFINSHNIVNDTIRVGIFNKQKWIKDVFTNLSLKKMNDEKQTILKIDPALPKGKYYLRFAINCSHNNPTHNNDKIELVIE
jgi:hypothetical protein